MKLPVLDLLEPEQFVIYEQPADRSILVLGPPGSGKTSIAIWRAIFIARQGKRVLLVTRNRMLAALAQQLSLEGGQQIETTTMHSFVWNDYRDRFGEGPTKDGDYELPWALITAQYDVLRIKPDIDHVIVDEGQNLPFDFFRWLIAYRGIRVSIFADEHQTTLVGGTTAAQLSSLGFSSFFPLTKNHRNTWEIAQFASHFHSGRKLPGACAQRDGEGERPRIITIQSWEALAEVIRVRLINRGGAIGVITHKQVDVNSIHGLLRKVLGSERVDSYTSRADRGGELIHMRDRGVTVISGESAIGLEFDTVYLHDLERSLPRRTAMHNRRLYMLAARARDFLFLVNGPKALTGAQLADLPPAPDLDR